jgi:hypothetical protein
LDPKERRNKMALQIEFEGFVQDVRNFDWGTVVVVAHNQRAKSASGQWETVGKDYIDVTFDGVTPEKDTLVKVKGTLKVSTYAKKDGSTGVALKVRASELYPFNRGDAIAATKDILEPLDPSLPF